MIVYFSDKAVRRISSTKTNASAELLGEATNALVDTIEIITSFNNQTKLLALNATIEEAHCSRAGEGFAVVANEIKELARQTNSASQDIINRIEGIQGATIATVGQVVEITRIIADANELVATVSTAVGEKTAATRKITARVTQASGTITTEPVKIDIGQVDNNALPALFHEE